jgi:hypothetical protein
LNGDGNKLIFESVDRNAVKLDSGLRTDGNKLIFESVDRNAVKLDSGLRTDGNKLIFESVDRNAVKLDSGLRTQDSGLPSYIASNPRTSFTIIRRASDPPMTLQFAP